jgi:hypothetical protein
VAQAGLGGLQIDAFGDESSGVEASEVVKHETVEADSLARRQPHSAAPVRVVEQVAVCLCE